MGPDSGSRVPGFRCDRGQTSLDFLIAVGVFLTTIGFVALFATDAVTPFVDDQSGALVVERTADELVGVTLAPPGGTNVLDETCTMAFFGVAGWTETGCQFQGQNPLDYTLDGVPDKWDVYITIERNDPAAGQEVLCADAGGVLPSCTSGTKLAIGETPDFGSDAIVTTIRVVTLDGRDVAVVVRLW